MPISKFTTLKESQKESCRDHEEHGQDAEVTDSKVVIAKPRNWYCWYHCYHLLATIMYMEFRQTISIYVTPVIFSMNSTFVWRLYLLPLFFSIKLNSFNGVIINDVFLHSKFGHSGDNCFGDIPFTFEWIIITYRGNRTR